jgi:hypothetical protein
MLGDTVLVRAWGGEPVKLVAITRGDGMVYAANPASLDRVVAGDSWPVGFPEEDVFQFDEEAYRTLLAKWRRARLLDRGQWHATGARRYSRSEEATAPG